MMLVSKNEAAQLRSNTSALIYITGRGKSGGRKKYYVEETRAAMRLLRELRGGKL